MEWTKSLSWMIGLVFCLIMCGSCGEYESVNEVEQTSLPEIITAEEALAIAEADGTDLEAVTYVDMVPYDRYGTEDFTMVWGVTEVLLDDEVLETYIDPYDGFVLAVEPPHEGLMARLVEIGADQVAEDDSLIRGSSPNTYESFPWGWQLPFENSRGVMTYGYGNYYTGTRSPYTHKRQIQYSTDWDPGNAGHSVYAPSSGWVMDNAYRGGFGYQLIVAGNCASGSCSNGGWGYRYLWRLSHFQSVSPAHPGWWIPKGYRVGAMGSTGNSSGPHIHFTAYRGTYIGSGNISGSSKPINHWPSYNDGLCHGALNSYNFWDSSYDYVSTGSNGCP